MDEFCGVSGVSLPPRRPTEFEKELIEVCRYALLSLTKPSIESQHGAIQELMRVVTESQVKFGSAGIKAIQEHWTDWPR